MNDNACVPVVTTDPSSSSAAAVDAAVAEAKRHFQTRPTVKLDPTNLKPSWAIVVASLEQMTSWAALALRLGTLALIQERVRDLADHDAKREGVAELRELVDALAHMPFDS